MTTAILESVASESAPVSAVEIAEAFRNQIDYLNALDSPIAKPTRKAKPSGSKDAKAKSRESAFNPNRENLISDHVESAIDATAVKALADVVAESEAGPVSDRKAGTSMTQTEFEARESGDVLAIVGKVCDAYASSSDLYIEIGADTFATAQRRHSYVSRHTAKHYEALINDIKSKCVVRLPVKPESIKVQEWVKAHCLREAVREITGDEFAESISVTEALILTPLCFKFDKATLDNNIHERWVGFFVKLSHERSDNFAATIGASFEAIIKEWQDKLTADANAALTAEQQAAAAVMAEQREKSAKIDKANRSVTTAVADAFEDGLLTPNAVLAIVETQARRNGSAIPASIGFDPIACTIEDCTKLAEAMYMGGKLKEMKVLRSRLSKLIDKAESQIAAMDSARIASETRINPLATIHATPAA